MYLSAAKVVNYFGLCKKNRFNGRFFGVGCRGVRCKGRKKNERHAHCRAALDVDRMVLTVLLWVTGSLRP